MNAQRDGRKYTDKNIYVVGGADGAVKEALYLSKFAKQVTIIHFEDTLGCIEEFKNKAEQTPNIKLRLGSRLHAVIWSRTGRSVGKFPMKRQVLSKRSQTADAVSLSTPERHRIQSYIQN